tara:strand:+ start:73911 stop:74165 length:255 start_codon:yes stop_codon:yes gene_type:complete
MKKEHKTTLLIVMSLLTLFALTAWVIKDSLESHEELKASKEQGIPSRSIYVDNSKIHTTVDIVEIDGVEYLIASTSRGVSICRK